MLPYLKYVQIVLVFVSKGAYIPHTDGHRGRSASDLTAHIAEDFMRLLLHHSSPETLLNIISLGA